MRLKLGHVLCRLDRLDYAEAVVSEIVEWTRDQSSHDVVEGLESLKETIQKCREAKASKTSDRMPAANERLPFEDEKSEAKKKKTRRGPPAKIKARLELMRLAVASGAPRCCSGKSCSYQKRTCEAGKKSASSSRSAKMPACPPG